MPSGKRLDGPIPLGMCSAAGLDPVEFSAVALPGPPSTIIISPFPFPFQVGETRQLDITVLDRYRNEITPIDPDLLSSDPDVAAVGPGVSRAVGEGTATVTAMYAAIRGSTTVSVVAPPS